MMPFGHEEFIFLHCKTFRIQSFPSLWKFSWESRKGLNVSSKVATVMYVEIIRLETQHFIPIIPKHEDYTCTYIVVVICFSSSQHDQACFEDLWQILKQFVDNR